MGSLSPVHWMIVLVVLVLLFGAKKLPDTAKALGQSLRIFKNETSRLGDEADTAVTQARTAPAVPDAEARLRALEEENARLRAAAEAARPDEPEAR
ncbi:Sec-independent protein translocase subunit TatA [Microbispora hainanensis]|jgi:sec-independent protein translocase protein TatA|uniref:Sec-independent protein translocase protein TatA n=1 Tax=Microbispora hainanensis TaxID=568844 RepID=A0ABZ1SNT3_9ACTN|nr:MULTISPECIES: Sec-independent protein translocase subunit TatA [Microbispora]NJP29798.1 Sec-independent protein translocase subunit TatA [Microbispora sp. CL1-1]TQS04112.1 twin-arginine translocase TatA/TatE family subunit [Microbispora sp. SCL1-1]